MQYLTKQNPKVPWSPILIVTSGLLAYWVHQVGDASLLPIVGVLPLGLPTPSLPSVSLLDVWRLFPTALIVAAVGFLESAVISKKYGEKHGYEVDADRELVALGVTNTVVSVFGGYPTTGSFAKTAINEGLGGKRQLSSLVAGLFVIFSVLFLTPLLTYIPRATLAGVIIVAVSQLFEVTK